MVFCAKLPRNLYKIEKKVYRFNMVFCGLFCVCESAYFFTACFACCESVWFFYGLFYGLFCVLACCESVWFFIILGPEMGLLSIRVRF